LSPSTRKINNEREHILTQGRRSLHPKDVYNSSVNDDSSSQRPSITGILNYENHKQFSNNPLKDISNQITNSIKSGEVPQNMKINNRYSMMPFEIAPKSVKVNNFIDQPFKSPDSTKLATLESTATRHSNKEETHSNRNSFGQKVSGFEEQHSKAGKVSKSNFEKKRMSDGAVLKAEDRNKFDDDVLRDIYERKDKNIRKGHNISVTTNTSTVSVNPN
jgi:hypothetical protein